MMRRGSERGPVARLPRRQVRQRGSSVNARVSEAESLCPEAGVPTTAASAQRQQDLRGHALRFGTDGDLVASMRLSVAAPGKRHDRERRDFAPAVKSSRTTTLTTARLRDATWVDLPMTGLDGPSRSPTIQPAPGAVDRRRLRRGVPRALWSRRDAGLGHVAMPTRSCSSCRGAASSTASFSTASTSQRYPAYHRRESEAHDHAFRTLVEVTVANLALERTDRQSLSFAPVPSPRACSSVATRRLQL